MNNVLKTYLYKASETSFIFMTSSLLAKVINFVTLPYLLNTLSVNDFGILDYFQTYFSLGSTLVITIASTSLIRFFLLYKDDPNTQRQIVGNSFLFIACTTSIIIILTIIIYNVTQTQSYTLPTMLMIALFCCFSLLTSYIRAQEYFYYYLALTLLQSISSSLLTLFLLYHYGIAAFFIATIGITSLFVPFFVHILKQHWYFSWPLFKQQCIFALPLLAYGFIYTEFFCLDRSIAQLKYGFELVASLGFLYRFGQIFQFISIALIDAWPFLIFNAQKEADNKNLISRLITYACGTLLTINIGLICASCLCIQWFMPIRYHHTLTAMPFFFCFLALIEIARIFQTEFQLQNKTFYILCTSGSTLLLQGLFLYYAAGNTLQSICVAQCASFSMYVLLNYIGTYYLSSAPLYEYKKLCSLFTLFFCYIILLTMAIQYSMLIVCCIGISWPVTLWFTSYFSKEEKLILKNYFYSLPLLTK